MLYVPHSVQSEGPHLAISAQGILEELKRVLERIPKDSSWLREVGRQVDECIVWVGLLLSTHFALYML